jgi:hypothetical protein
VSGFANLVEMEVTATAESLPLDDITELVQLA